GEAALNSDLQSRGTAMTHVVDLILRDLTPAQGEWLDAFAAGVNEYVTRARTRRLPPPSEYVIAAALLGLHGPGDLMEPFARRDMAAILSTLIYELGYETDDIDHAATEAAMPGNFEPTAALRDLRRAGARTDCYDRIVPMYPVSSAAGEGLDTMAATQPPRRGDSHRGAPASRMARTRGVNPMLALMSAHGHEIQRRLGRVEGFGSNAWAVSGSRSRDGASLLASDGHLPLTVPSLFYQIGLDTAVLGGGNMTSMGLTIPGFPLMAVGTNGRVAWSQTQLSGDITDWYREQITLDSAGLPQSSLFQGTMRPLVRADETFVIADRPALGSVGRTETWPRWETFDGRWITSIEGRTVTRTEPIGAGETRVELLGSFVVPRDMDGDGIVSALSFDYTGLDGGNLLGALDGFNLANNVEEFRQATRGLVAYSQNLVATDRNGSILYSSYQGVPCRGYLPRNPDGSFMPGANPWLLIDGTRFHGFRVPITNGRVDEAPGATDPYACVVPFDRTPQSMNPTRGYVLTANNDPGGMTFDNNLTNEPFYLGGPWDSWRAQRINQLLAVTTADRSADEDRMSAIQADHHSIIGEEFAPHLIEAIAAARTAAAGTPVAGSAEARIAAIYTANATAMNEVERRLTAWRTAGYDTPSGVETFYHASPASEHDDSVATTIFNAYVGRFVSAVWDDEPLAPGAFESSAARIRTTIYMQRSRGTNTDHLASYNPATGESAFFDVLSTAPIETSREVMLTSLVSGLDFLRSPQTAPGSGGFGTADMNRWIWGLRHTLQFKSLLADFLGNNAMLAPLVDTFSIGTAQLPLAPSLLPGDPRAGLAGFPRGGDQWNIDAANPGFGGSDFTYGSGPNFRMVIALRPTGGSGRNVIPGGQSGLNNSPNFSDQAALWLGNRTMPMYLTAPEVVAHAIRRESYHPAP
ncbi:MAG: penicillin acylase family protein, partial [Deltaproteobacteria bacterium]